MINENEDKTSVFEEMEEELEKLTYLAVAAMVVLLAVGLFGWLVL